LKKGKKKNWKAGMLPLLEAPTLAVVRCTTRDRAGCARRGNRQVHSCREVWRPTRRKDNPTAFEDRDGKATPNNGARVTFAYVFSSSAERLSVSQFLSEVCFLEPLAAAVRDAPARPRESVGDTPTRASALRTVPREAAERRRLHLRGSQVRRAPKRPPARTPE